MRLVVMVMNLSMTCSENNNHWVAFAPNQSHLPSAPNATQPIKLMIKIKLMMILIKWLMILIKSD